MSIMIAKSPFFLVQVATGRFATRNTNGLTSRGIPEQLADDNKIKHYYLGIAPPLGRSHPREKICFQ